MPPQQRNTGVDMHGEDYQKAKKKEEKRKLKAARKALDRAQPVTAKLASDAQNYGNQAAWNQQANNTMTADANYDQINGYSSVNQQFVSNNISTGSYYQQSNHYQFGGNNAGNSYHQKDVNTNYLVKIIDEQTSKERGSSL